MRTAHTSREFRAHAPPGKVLFDAIKREQSFSLGSLLMQSSVFWRLKFSKCLDSILNMLMLKYLINHRCGCGKRSKTLYDASRSQSDCGDSTSSRQRRRNSLPEKLSNPVCLRRIACIMGALVICGLKCRLRTQILFLLTMLIKENI